MIAAIAAASRFRRARPRHRPPAARPPTQRHPAAGRCGTSPSRRNRSSSTQSRRRCATRTRRSTDGRSFRPPWVAMSTTARRWTHKVPTRPIAGTKPTSWKPNFPAAGLVSGRRPHRRRQGYRPGRQDMRQIRPEPEQRFVNRTRRDSLAGSLGMRRPLLGAGAGQRLHPRLVAREFVRRAAKRPRGRRRAHRRGRRSRGSCARSARPAAPKCLRCASARRCGRPRARSAAPDLATVRRESEASGLSSSARAIDSISCSPPESWRPRLSWRSRAAETAR